MQADVPMNVKGAVVTMPSYASAGDYLLVATGTGDTVRQARGGAYRVLKSLKDTPGSPFWRVDIGQRLRKELPEYQRHGFALSMKF
jgi:phosphoribosylamine--glycine ligase